MIASAPKTSETQEHGLAVGTLHLTMPISLRTKTDPMGGNRATLMRFDVPVANPTRQYGVKSNASPSGRSRGEGQNLVETGNEALEKDVVVGNRAGVHVYA